MKWLLPVALGASLMVNGGLTLLAWTSTSTEIAATAKIKKLEADVRTYAGKYLDLQESMEDTLQESKQGAELEHWRLKSELDVCLNGGKK